MLIDRQTKKVLKAIAKQQSKGVTAGDMCPRCGRPAMVKASKENMTGEFRIFVCDQCAMDIALSCITGEDMSYKNWAAVSNAHIDSDGAWSPEKSPVKREILPRFQKGDRIYDSRSDWPCTVMDVLANGLYFVRLDGSHEEELILKDQESTFEMGPDLAAYVAFLKERLAIGTMVRIEKIQSEPGNAHAGKVGEILEISSNGKVVVKMLDEDEIVSICPDADFFVLVGEKVVPDRTPFEINADDIVIDF